MQTEKIVINPTEGTHTLVIREGAAEKLLDPKPPVKVNISGTLDAPIEYLTKRANKEQFDINRCHVLVNREKLSIELVVNDHDEYLRGTVVGMLEFNAKFKEFGINTGKVWAPTELGLFIKMNRSFFADKSTAMALTTELMNFKATVDNKIDQKLVENGSKTDNFSSVVNSNLPPSFKVKLQIFKGSATEEIEVETFAQIDGRDVAFTLISPGANESLENTRDNAIDRVLEQIKATFAEIVVIEK
jgi:hypothetical protein